jgi:hypothetical protein
MFQMYVVTDKNNIVILNGTQESFRCRQRCINSDGSKVPSFKFVSYRSMMKEAKKNKQKVYKGFKYDTIAKL